MAATHTTNLNLNKPARTDFVSVVSDINDNMDILDGAIGAVPQGETLQGQIDDVSNEIGTVPSGETLQGQIDAKADKDNTVLTSSLSMGRKPSGTVGANSNAIGYNVEASGDYSHAEGYQTIANHNAQHVFGQYNVADTSTNPPANRGNFVEIVGVGTGTSNRSNGRTLDWGGNEHLKGDLYVQSTTGLDGKKVATEENPVFTGSISLGRKANTTIGERSFAVGNNVQATDYNCHAEGSGTIASGYTSHAEGNATTSSGQFSHAEGKQTQATNDGAHAEGNLTQATGKYSHAEGSETFAYGDYSHSEGKWTIADGVCSHAEGEGTTASGDYQHVSGKYNATDSTSFEIVGNGTGTNARKNVRLLDVNGNEKLKGDIYVGCNDDSTGGTALGAEVEGVKSSIGTVPTGHTVMGDISDVKSAINDIEDIVYYDSEIDLSSQSTIAYAISPSTGKWTPATTYKAYMLSVPSGAEYLKITPNVTNGTVYAMLKTSGHPSGTTPDYATGETRTFITVNTTVKIPSDCAYVYISKKLGGSGTDYNPSYVAFGIKKNIPNVDNTLSISGDAADAKKTGDELNVLFDLASAPVPLIWEIGKTISAEGLVGNSSYSALSSFSPKVSPFLRGGSLTDGNGNNLNVYVAQYNGNTFISRDLFNVLNTKFSFNANCTHWRILIGRSSSLEIDMDQETIDTYFKPYTYVSDAYIVYELQRLSNYHPSYAGKKLSILGDSISTFAASDEKTDGKAAEGCTTNYPGNPVQYSNSNVTSVDLTWWGQVLNQFGMVLGINESWAGSTIGYNQNQTAGGKYTADNCLCSATRIGHLGENGTPDLIIIFGGTNDINHHRVGSGNTLRYAVGELDSTHNPYDFDNFPMITDTYYGSITTMLLRIQHTYPNATILMLLPYFCTYTHTSSGDIATPADQNEWSNASIDVCKFLGVEYLDLRTIINLYDVSSLLFDGLHPKANGMSAIAKAVIHKLNSML